MVRKFIFVFIPKNLISIEIMSWQLTDPLKTRSLDFLKTITEKSDSQPQLYPVFERSPYGEMNAEASDRRHE